MNSITIRQAVSADLDAVVTLIDDYRQFYGQPRGQSIESW
jgi:hypothetical protein